jgi:anti-sigma factor RsiW
MTAHETTTSRLNQQELGACALIQDLLPLYLEGEVTPASRDLVAEHLARCERCAGFMAGARSVREQLRRESALRETNVERDQAARQAIVTGQRRVMALALGVFAMLSLSMAATSVAVNFFHSSASAPAPLAEPAAMPPMPGMPDDIQQLEAEQRRRAEAEAGGLVWDPQANQFIDRPTAPPMPTATPAPWPTPVPSP